MLAKSTTLLFECVPEVIQIGRGVGKNRDGENAPPLLPSKCIWTDIYLEVKYSGGESKCDITVC